MLIAQNTTTDTKPEIQNIMTISTMHLTEDTMKQIDQNQNSYNTLSIYPKINQSGALSALIGYFIYVLHSTAKERKNELPDDLFAVTEFAIKNNCNMICLDWDGPIIPDIKYYYEMEIKY